MTVTIKSFRNQEWDAAKLRIGLNEVTEEELAELNTSAGFRKGVKAGVFVILSASKPEVAVTKTAYEPPVDKPDPVVASKPAAKTTSKKETKELVAPPPWDK